MADAHALLLAEIRADREALAAHHRKVVGALPDLPEDPGAEAIVASAVHHYYTALKSLFERIARAFEGPPARGDRWHQDLLRAMSLHIEEVRPPVVAPERLPVLRDLLGFRHFFRHAYAVELDPIRLRDIAERLIAVHPMLREDLDAFEARLRSA